MLLQDLVDADVIAPSQTYKLQCLGIVLGDRLVAAVDGFAWVMVDDEYRETSLQFGVLTMISKRIERGDDVDVAAMFSWLVAKAFELLRDGVD